MRVWREGGRAEGFLKVGAGCVAVPLRGGSKPELGMPLARRAADGTREARLGLLVKGAFVFGLAAVGAA